MICFVQMLTKESRGHTWWADVTAKPVFVSHLNTSGSKHSAPIYNYSGAKEKQEKNLKLSKIWVFCVLGAHLNAVRPDPKNCRKAFMRLSDRALNGRRNLAVKWQTSVMMQGKEPDCFLPLCVQQWALSWALPFGKEIFRSWTGHLSAKCQSKAANSIRNCSEEGSETKWGTSLCHYINPQYFHFLEIVCRFGLSQC